MMLLDVSKFHHEADQSFRTICGETKPHKWNEQNFWSQTKRILRKYNGIDRKNFAFILEGDVNFEFNFWISQKNNLKHGENGVVF